MTKKDKLIKGLIIGGAIGSVLGIAYKKQKGDNNFENASIDLNPSDDEKKDSMLKPKRKGIILRLIDWLEKKD